MWTRHHRSSPFRFVILPVVTAGVLAYFGHHALTGTFGIASNRQYEARIVALRAELADVAGERAALERKTAMLRDGSLEHDMIDEQARRMLGVTRGNEIVILTHIVN